MPIYEYQCTTCGHQLEAFQGISEAALVECPVCHKSSLIKLMSATGFQLKGTGWYATDYSSKNKAKQAQSENEQKPQPDNDQKPSTEKADAKTPESKTTTSESKATDSSTKTSSSSDSGAST